MDSANLPMSDTSFTTPHASASSSAPPSSAHNLSSTLSDSIHNTCASSSQRKAEDKNRWTTPGLPPLAFAPYVAPSTFSRELPSEKRYQMLFPSDPEKRARMKDLDGELEALNQYLLSVCNPDPNVQEAPGRRRFYDGLATEVEQDYEELRYEATKLYMEASVLGRFEYDYSDNSPGGGFTQLEDWLRNGREIVNCEHPDVRAKYAELFERTREERDRNIRSEDGGVGEVETGMERVSIW